MFKRFKKIAAVAMAASLMLQGGVTGLAAEGQAATETVTEAAATEKATEAQTPAATEAQTQAATEAQTQAATEAQTPAATEAQTQAATEAQTPAATEAQQTQAATEAQTPAATEAQQTQAATEASSEKTTEQSETQAEKKEKKKKAKKRSKRKNDGEKMTSSDLVSGLDSVLSYLFAAEQVEGPETLLQDQKVLEKSNAVSSLKDFSVKLANAQSSSDVKVINLYADADGELDTAQLKKAFDGQVIDVTNQYCVVNVIADSADQALSFSGYQMVLSGQTVHYESGAQAGDIIYNFAAMDGDEFTDYTGALTLSNGSGLQGTFLAPAASVKVQSDLAGGVYAQNVTVGDSVTELLAIAFSMAGESGETESESAQEATGEPESENAQETTGEPESESAVSETESESVQEVTGEPVSESAVPETDETESESVQEMTGEPVSESAVSETDETESESAQEATDEAESESADLEISTEEVTAEELEQLWMTEETETESSSESGEDLSEEGQEDGSEDEALLVEEEPAEETVYYSEVAAGPLSVVLKDAGSSAAISSGSIAVKTAANIVDADGNVLVKKDGEVVAAQSAAGTPVSIGGEKLQTGGKYYLEIMDLPAGYLGAPRIYFSINEQGTAVIDSALSSQVSLSDNVLTVSLYAETTVPNGSVQISVVKEDGITPITSAAFVVKDSNGMILRDADGIPTYYVAYAGAPVVLTGLQAGNYFLSQISTETGYQIAADTAFTVTDTADTPITVTNKAASGTAFTVSAQARYNSVILWAEQNMQERFYLALFDEAGTKRVSEVKELQFVPDSQTSAALSFEKVAARNYLLKVVDEYGQIRTDAAYQIGLAADTASQSVTADGAADQTVSLYCDYALGSYPTGNFYYYAKLALTKNVIGRDGNALAVAETFYMTLQDAAQNTVGNLYDSTGTDGAPGALVTAFPLAFAMNNSTALTQNYYLRMNTAEAVYSLVETDSAGQPVSSDSDFAYAVTCRPESGITVSCGAETGTGTQKTTEAVVENRLNDSQVVFRVVDESGKYLSGATLVLKNSNGNAIKVNNKETYTSGTSDIVLKNLLTEGNTYYLSEITAPSGYTPAEDVSFTVKRGAVTEVVLVNKKTSSTDYSITATKQVYAGQNQVYGYDTTSKTYAAEGRYTFYAALFSDVKCTKKVTNVQTITVSGFGGTTTFQNLKHGETYYIAETNKYGVPRKNTSSLTIQYSDSGKIQLTAKNQTTTITNVYSSLPRGYRYTGTLTITKRVVDSTGAAARVTGTFYAGIYKKSDYSDTPTIVKLELNNASSASVKRRILLSGSSDMVYYIAEVDASGNRLSDSSDFDYTISLDKTQATVAKGANTSVTITNKQKTTSSKVTLYITKRVYDGASPKKVTQTFYAGLFKDAQFTQAYTKPIALSLKDKSELTLKLSLNLGSASSANIYIAEVDANGNVIKDQQSFGYEVKLVNSTAAFTAERREVQTILINSVYGSTSSDDWNQILSSGANYMGGGGYISDNGEASEYTADSVKTGDSTPILPALAAMAAAAAAVGYLIVRRRRRAK